MRLLWKRIEPSTSTIASKTLDTIAQITRSPITALKPLQNAHLFEHGCSYAVKHKEVRERSDVHSAFSSVLPCTRAS